MFFPSALPNVISYNAAISACDNGRQWQQALGVLAAMLQTAALPNVIKLVEYNQ